MLEEELDVAGQPPCAAADHDPEEVRTWISALDVLGERLRERAELGHDEGLLAMALDRAGAALAIAGDDPGLRAARRPPRGVPGP
ncbi:hypothetical protein [Streptomyces flavalbus]|uniref:PH domain-containing protein n=1 Tax=Streptomyces flavalbus TaxID=2665155 RepID=A0ABW2WHG8_9ACTN